MKIGLTVKNASTPVARPKRPHLRFPGQPPADSPRDRESDTTYVEFWIRTLRAIVPLELG
jgi:hypothetical protein